MVHAGSGREAGDEEMELVPRQKLEKMGEEFTRLLTSQLENQRVYFEEKLSAVADRAAASARQAEEAIATSERVIAEMKLLKEEQEKLTKDTVPSLERDRARLSARAEKSAELARNITKSFQEEKVVSKGLMERVEHLNTLVKKLQDDVRETRLENEDLKEQNRDLSFFISSKEKLESVDDELKEEIREGTLAVPEPKQDKKKKRGKGKGKEQGEGSK
jgi:BRCA1-associated protein